MEQTRKMKLSDLEDKIQNGAVPLLTKNAEMITQLALMSSLGCNLSCDYCLIAKSKKNNLKHAAELQKKNIEALKDGSFIENAKKVLLKLGGSPNDIIHIELWGQEQTLVLEHIINDLDHWLETFPNLQELMFSTNGQAYPDKIFDLAVALDQKTKRKFQLNLQFSYDGSYSCTNIRHDTDVKVIKNMEYLIDKFNQTKLHNVHVEMYLHGVVSMALIKYLNNDMQKIAAYWEEGEKEAKRLEELCLNEKVIIYPTFSVAEEVPYHCSKEEGLMYFDFLIRSLTTGGENKGLDFLVNQCLRIIDFSFKDKADWTLDEIVNWLAELPYNHTIEDLDKITRLLTNGFYCGGGVTELKLLYDGTLINCQNSIFDKDIEFLSKENTILDATKRSWASCPEYFLNPLDPNVTQEQIDKYRYIFITGRTSTFWHTWITTIATMNYLAEAGQILPSYLRDLNKLVRHAYIISFVNQCYFNNGIYTGSMWTKDSGIIRRYCNGFLDYCEEEENNIRKNKDFLKEDAFCDCHN